MSWYSRFLSVIVVSYCLLSPRSRPAPPGPGATQYRFHHRRRPALERISLHWASIHQESEHGSDCSEALSSSPLQTPLCSPSRATFLTGLYAHTHGVTDNTNHDVVSHRLETFLLHLKRSGYETAFLGKWHMGTDDSPRPGIDHWISFKGQGRFLDPEINVNGKAETVKGYATDTQRGALEFLKRKHDRPFVLYLSHKAVHPNVEQRPDGTLTDQPPPTSSRRNGTRIFTPTPRFRAPMR